MSKQSGAGSSLGNWPFWFVVLVFAAASILYRVQFGTALSTSQEVWGQFGDYLGGVINPIVGLVTVVLLLSTLHAQRKELDEAKLSNFKQDLYRSAELVFQEIKGTRLELAKLTNDGKRPAILQSPLGRPIVARFISLTWELADYLQQIDILSLDRSSTDYYRRRVIVLVRYLRTETIPDSLIDKLTPRVLYDVEGSDLD